MKGRNGLTSREIRNRFHIINPEGGLLERTRGFPCLQEKMEAERNILRRKSRE